MAAHNYNGALDKTILDRFMALDITASKKVLFMTAYVYKFKVIAMFNVAEVVVEFINIFIELSDTMHVHLDRRHWREPQGQDQNSRFHT